MHGDADIARVGALVADPARARVLMALGDGRALPATVLADEAGVAASTTSAHLGKLVKGGLLTVERHGRHRYFRIAGPEVADLLEALARVSPPAPVRSLRQGTRAQAVRFARTCYDHLAGVLGTELMAAMLERRAADRRRRDVQSPSRERRSPGCAWIRLRLSADGTRRRASQHVRHRLRCAAAAAAAGPLLRRLERAAPPSRRLARGGAVRPDVRARLVAAGAAEPRGADHRRRDRRPAALLRPQARLIAARGLGAADRA